MAGQPLSEPRAGKVHLGVLLPELPELGPVADDHKHGAGQVICMR